MNNRVSKITLMAIGAVINIIGGFIAVSFKLPIYLDTIGTFLSAFLLGPIAGILTGIVTSLVNGIAFDPVSFFFMPVQIIIGLVAGILYKKGLFKGKLIPVGIIVVTVCGSIVAAAIAAYVFGGITSSGTSFIVMYLKEAGVEIITSVFSTQIISDLIDKTIAVISVLFIIKAIPTNLKNKFN